MLFLWRIAHTDSFHSHETKELSENTKECTAPRYDPGREGRTVLMCDRSEMSLVPIPVPGETPTAAVAEELAKLMQTRLGSEFGPDDEKFDGKENCLDHTLWAPALRAMYRKVKPPPR